MLNRENIVSIINRTGLLTTFIKMIDGCVVRQRININISETLCGFLYR